LPDASQPSDPPALAKGYVTFGVFNRGTKISEAALSLWARILHAVPRSRLLLKHYGFDHAALRGRLIEKFAAHGIAAERISFLGTTSRDEHLAAFSAVDISLDPFPHNGGISTWGIAANGVPVVALLGQTIASGAAGAILLSVGMTDWVAQSAEEYLAIAVKFASAPEHLKALRRELPGAALSFRGRQQRALHRGGRGGLSDHVGRLLPARTEARLN
jgi:predicted O-linked N-acetylglucosamine transferase (SPINDLY family)